MRESNSPMVLWYYAIERRAIAHKIVPRDHFQDKGKTPHALLVIKVTFVIFAILASVNGSIIVILVPSLKTMRS